MEKEAQSPRMSHDLYKSHDGSYIVASFRLKTPYVLPSIEGASEALAMLGVPEDEIDFALIDMLEKGNTHAQFGVLNGLLIFTDKQEPPIDLPLPPSN